MHIDTTSLALTQQRLRERIASGRNSGLSCPGTAERVALLTERALSRPR